MGKPVAVVCATILLIAMIATFTYGIVHYTGHNKNASKEHAPSTTNKAAIESICKPTSYRDTCVSSLQGAAGNTSDPKQLVQLGFKLANQAVLQAIAQSSTIKAAQDDPRSAQALEICREVMVYARNDLQRTVDTCGSLNNVQDVNQFVENIKVWLGGAATYQDVCFDAFENATNTDAGLKMRQFFNASRELTSNALTMTDEVKKMISMLDIPAVLGASRRLLGEAPIPQPGGIPAWMSDEQRNILEKPVTELKFNAIVALDGSAEFSNIGAALASVPKHNNKTFLVYIKAGIYHEHVTISKKMTNVVLVGDGATKTIITGKKNFVDGIPTYKTATVAAVGEGFMARDIGVENTAGAEKHQAVAMRVAGDFSVLYRCEFNGFQDTLYAVRGRQFYRDCKVTGTIDFIFGDAQAVFQNCDIQIRKPLENQQCEVTAQGRNEPNGPGALVLQNCSITGQPDYLAVKDDSPSFLGRPWKAYSRTIVMQSYIDGCISPKGWAPWAGTFGLDTLFYAEYENRGPGAEQAGRVTWKGIQKLSRDQITEFTPNVLFMGDKWVATTGAPYSPALMVV